MYYVVVWQHVMLPHHHIIHNYVISSSGSLHLSLVKVTLMLKQSVKLRSYVLCGGVAA
jgi:hypothetical protein